MRARASVVVGALLLFSLGAAGQAWAADGERPSNIIFDPSATPSWTAEVYGTGAVSDTARDVAIASSGAVYVVGSIDTGPGSSATLMKYVNGTASWPSPRTYVGPWGGSNSFACVATGPGNTIYTAGNSTSANMLSDIVVVKWSASGEKLWQKRYDSAAHTVDGALAMAVDAAGNVSVCGVTFDGISQDGVVVNWSSSGSRRWARALDAPAGGTRLPISLAVTSDSNVYATGISLDATGEAALTVRFSASGELKWQKLYRGPAAIRANSRAVVAHPAGGVLVCGTTDSGATGEDGLVMSYTKSGARDVYALDTGAGGAISQAFADLAVTSTGQVVAVGANSNAGAMDCRLVTYTVDGTIAAGLTLPGPWDDQLVDVDADAFGGYYATGPYHTALNKTAFIVFRGSVVTGGGGFLSLWAPAAVSEANYPYAIAVRGLTAVVVGNAYAGPASDVDQAVLGYVY